MEADGRRWRIGLERNGKNWGSFLKEGLDLDMKTSASEDTWWSQRSRGLVAIDDSL